VLSSDLAYFYFQNEENGPMALALSTDFWVYYGINQPISPLPGIKLSLRKCASRKPLCSS